MRISGRWLLLLGSIAGFLLSGTSRAQDYNPSNPGETGSPPGPGCQIGTSGCYPSAPPGPQTPPSDPGATTDRPPATVATDDVPFYGRLPASTDAVPPVVNSPGEQQRQAAEQARLQEEQYRQQQQQLLGHIEQQQKLLDAQQEQLQTQQRQIDELRQRDRQFEDLRQKMQEKPAQGAGTGPGGNQVPGAQQPGRPRQTTPPSPAGTPPQPQQPR